MKYPDSYFEDEIQCGFYVSAMMKSCWAAQIEVLLEIDRICKKYNIQYFAEWGTLLGTIRHGGYIPWDDDLDIAMKRLDYERFQKLVVKEMPEGYEILNYATDANYWDVMMRVINGSFASFDPEFLDRYHNTPYACGVDIFPLDYVPRDKGEEAIQRELVEMVKTIADSNGMGSFTEEQLEALLTLVERCCGQKIDREGNIKNQLYKILCALYAMYTEPEADQIALIPQYLDTGASVYPKECYADSIRMPFDRIDIPVPMGYDTILKLKYGDYMKNVRKGGGHEYPFHERQEGFLAEKGVKLPKYEYPGNLADRIKNPTFRQGLEKKLKLLEQIHEKIELLVSCGQSETVYKLLQELQNVAVVIGNSIEKKVGQGTEAVAVLEQYCEVAYELHETLTQSMVTDGKAVRSILDETLGYVHQAVEALKVKKEIVFMPCRSTHWKALESVWRSACAEEDCEVRVVPLPYYYKRRMGAAISEIHWDGEEFPEEVPVIPYLDYDLENNHPDVIYIQMPYDEWNHALTVHNDYYAPKLWQNTEELIYIPWFKLDEMRPDDERALKTRRYYVPMPGVVHADKVIVQSEGMKQSYVDYLSEWAGEETRPIWEAKVLGLGSPLDDVEPETAKRPTEWGDKKVILYHVSGNGLMEHKDRMLEKIQNTLQIFDEQAEKLQIVWLQDVQLRKRLVTRTPEVLRKYERILDKCRRKPWYSIMAAEEEETAVQLADAFYGDAGKSAQLMKQASKPVMLQNVEV